MNFLSFFHFNNPGDEIETSRISYLTGTIILSTIIVTSTLAIIKIILPPAVNFSDYIIWVQLALYISAYFLLKKGRVNLAGFLFVLVFWSVMTVLALSFGGVKDIAVVGYILIILTAMLISKPWHALIISLLSILSLWLLFFAEVHGIVIPQQDSSLNYTIEFTVILVLVITLIYLQGKTFSNLYKRIKEELSERRKYEEQMLKQARLQELLITMSNTYINLPLDEFESSITASLEELGEFVGADRCYIFKYASDMKYGTETHEWSRSGISSQIDTFHKFVIADIPDWDIEAHKMGEAIFIADGDALPEGNLKKVFISASIKTLLAVPLMNSIECVGFVGFDFVRNHHDYSFIEQNLLKVFSLMLVNIQKRIKGEELLISAKEKAEESNRLKTAFMNNISHEVRTPLNGIVGFSQFIIDPATSEKEKEFYLDILNSNSERLVNTITNYMDISLITSGNVPLRKKAYLLSGMIDELYEKYESKCISKNLLFYKKISPETIDTVIEIDSSLFEKAISHLLDNAIKFTKTGSITLALQLKSGQYEISVKDTGIGIKQDAKDQIFNYFVQEETSSTRQYEGSGLGLSIAKELVELMGGEISVESVRGEGSIFSVFLPISSLITKDFDKRDIEMPEPGKVLSPQLLIVDDDEASFYYHVKLLEALSYRYLTARNGSEAIEICNKNTDINIVLMDIKMPLMDGIEATKQIRKLRDDIKIIGVTAYAMMGDKETALAAGFNDYITKPIKAEMLNSLIQKYL